ncbi:MAG: ATP-binding cassette domain-containing protein [Deltaproteobacteria bacterium]|jgi:ABC-type nitrate/sulfonate/bicarbonate transport system ATPase subunit|nr:ATP-binding cassette domain-containing protein [Deltaproteobacteria bacterium]
MKNLPDQSSSSLLPERSWPLTPLVELNSVSKSFGEQLVIKKASLRHEGGQVLALTGPSGTGKSTILEILAGITAPDQGRVSLRGQATLMFQDNALIPWLNALTNITYILKAETGSRPAKLTALNWLKTFKLDPWLYPGAMSSGMRRRLSLARTLAANRPIILLDEPFAFLDGLWHETIAKLIAAETERGSAIILTGHSLPEPFLRLLGGRLKEIIVTSPIVIEEA